MFHVLPSNVPTGATASSEPEEICVVRTDAVSHKPRLKMLCVLSPRDGSQFLQTTQYDGQESLTCRSVEHVLGKEEHPWFEHCAPFVVQITCFHPGLIALCSANVFNWTIDASNTAFNAFCWKGFSKRSSELTTESTLDINATIMLVQQGLRTELTSKWWVELYAYIMNSRHNSD